MNKFVQIRVSFKEEDFEKISLLSKDLGLSESQLVRNLCLDSLSDVSFVLKFASPFLFLGSKKKND